MSEKKTLANFIGILKTDGDYDFEEARKSAQDYVGKKYAEKEKRIQEELELEQSRMVERKCLND